jgi:hypothetical protein
VRMRQGSPRSSRGTSAPAHPQGGPGVSPACITAASRAHTGSPQRDHGTALGSDRPATQGVFERCRILSVGVASVVSLYRVQSLFGRIKAFVLRRIRLGKLACTRYRDTTPCYKLREIERPRFKRSG